MSSDLFDGVISFLGVALMRMGLLESLGKIVVLIRGGRVEAEGDGILSG